MLDKQAIKYEIEQSSCVIHNQHPTVTVNEAGDKLVVKNLKKYV